ncbi:GFA family protein [Baekduia soli]|uniref:GFA family protein n=1 Tax=Baekduia soli TaxID=496014 RepID=A0A5B8U7K4_9ACTN|nr:GFA family protein [Baekduia soli]QEC48990.1 GFA family protein [Baekduia soli]
MSEPALTGGCLCGAVRFEISEPLSEAGHCHCTRCQRRTGTASSAAGLTVPGSFRITQGAEHVRAWHPDRGFDKGFCSACGGHLFARDPGDDTVVAVRLGAIDGDPGVRPSYHQFTAFAAPWQPLPDDGLPRHPERRPR